MVFCDGWKLSLFEEVGAIGAGAGEALGGGEAKGGGEAEGEGSTSYAMASGRLKGAALGLIMAGRKRGLLGALAGGTAAARAAAAGVGTGGGGGGHEGGGDEGGSSAGGGEDDQAMSVDAMLEAVARSLLARKHAGSSASSPHCVNLRNRELGLDHRPRITRRREASQELCCALVRLLRRRPLSGVLRESADVPLPRRPAKPFAQ